MKSPLLAKYLSAIRRSFYDPFTILIGSLLLLIFIACNNHKGQSSDRNADKNSVSSNGKGKTTGTDKNDSEQTTGNKVQPRKKAVPAVPAIPKTAVRKTVVMNELWEPAADQSVNGIIVPGTGYGASTNGTTVKRKMQNANTNSYAPTSEGESFNTEDYNNIVENIFRNPGRDPLSTFSIDVDEAAYSNVRRYLLNGSLPPAGAVRIEEMINYFDYDYPQPVNGDPFSVNTEISECPWNTQHRLVHIGLQGKTIPIQNLPNTNLVFLIDVSGSMQDMNKLPLVKASMKMLAEQLRENDKVAIVVYAGNAGLVLPSTSGSNKIKIKEAIDNLEAGGSTAGGEGIRLAYQTARENFIKGGNNRIILATDGDFNVGASSDDDLVRLVEKERQSGVFLSVLGYGMGNYKDNKMQQLADKGNGNHSYIDNINEAKKVLVNEFGSTLFAIAKDVKIQIEFNPAKVQAYRLIGYENRMLASEDFNDDKKDAGELGSGHTVTALYEIIPAGVKNDFAGSVDPLKYQASDKESKTVYADGEVMNIKVRYKKPDEDISKLIVHPVADRNISLSKVSDNFRFSAAVASFGLLLRNSEFRQQASYDQTLSLARGARGKDLNGYRQEFIQLVAAANGMVKN